jgi:hypothetical protein
VERARADLEHGKPRKARERLKGWIATYPEDREARGLLAQAYRLDGQPTEAGRWGYLVGAHATDEERAAFEVHCAFGWASRITEARLRHLLHCSDLTAIADAEGLALLADLPTRKNPRRTDGPLARLGRWLSQRRAQKRYP